jgi:protein-S-isoprenylcysteine O-methyltransferase Ste14
MYGAQNTEEDVFFSDRDEAVIVVKDRNGVQGLAAVLTNLAAWCADGTIASVEDLRSNWLSSDAGERSGGVVRDESQGSESPVPEVTNLGLVRPPLVYLGAIALGLVVHVLWPVRLVPRALGTLVGAMLMVVAVIVFVWAARTFRTAGTPIPGNRPTTMIVRTGPYRLSRNPIYFAFSLFQLGLAFWMNSLGLLITLVPAVALMSSVVISREERYLAARFPAEYALYKASVRRWL